jgi:DNA-binding SARP family transcriptional activator
MPKPKHVKQDEAEARHEAYRNLTPESRIERLLKRPGKSEREHNRLLRAIEKRGRVSAKKEALKDV